MSWVNECGDGGRKTEVSVDDGRMSGVKSAWGGSGVYELSGRACGRVVERMRWVERVVDSSVRSWNVEVVEDMMGGKKLAVECEETECQPTVACSDRTDEERSSPVVYLAPFSSCNL
jgi:hypothetical protein